MTPPTIADNFERRIRTAISNHRELVSRLSGKPRRASLEGILSEQFIMTIAVKWEAFLHELLIAYIHKRPNNFLNKLETKIKQHNNKLGGPVSRFIRFNKPNAPNIRLIEKMLDPDGFNLSFNSADKLASKATECLTGRYAIKFSMSADDRKMFDFFIALRNFLAHQSDQSRRQLKSKILALGNKLPNSNFYSARIVSIAAYLRRRIGPTKNRAELIAERLIEMTQALR